MPLVSISTKFDCLWLVIVFDLDVRYLPCRELLIGDARGEFKSQIPESLRRDLIERLLSFSQEKSTI